MNPADAQVLVRPVVQQPPQYITHDSSSQMPSNELIDIVERLGVPFAVVCASFYFILYLTKQSAKERDTFWKRDQENDTRLMSLVETSSDALLQVKIALEANTAAMREMVRYKSS
jgi:hypothetical protein